MTASPTIRRSRVSRRIVGGLCAVTLFLQMGCYSYRPLQTGVPATGQRIAVVLNDRGRAALGDRVGPAVDVVEGLLVSASAESVELEVYRTTDLRGRDASWTGEKLQVSKEFVSGYRERFLSKRKTYLLAGTVLGAVVLSAMLTNFDLFNGWIHADPTTPPTGGSR